MIFLIVVVVLLAWLLLRPRKTIIVDPMTRRPIDPRTGETISQYAGLPRGAKKPALTFALFLALIFGAILLLGLAISK